MGDEFTTTMRFKVDIGDFSSAMREAQRSIKTTNAEFNAATAGMNKWSDNADGLTAKLKQLDGQLTGQKRILEVLENQYESIVQTQGANSEAAENMRIRILNQQATIKKTASSIEHYTESLNNLGDASEDSATGSKKAAKGIDDVADSAGSAENDVEGLTGKLGDLAKKGFAAVGAAAASAATAFLGSAEATREYREDMNKLQTAYQSAGHSAETATEMYKSFFSVLGEEDRSVEAVAHLAKLTTNQKELAKWSDIAAGVWGTFGDSLPIEGLTEAANETAKTGEVVGVLADALNWAGLSQDDFNKKLSTLNSEQDRATYITETLNNAYAEASAKYKELNDDVMEAQRAQSELSDATAKVGAAAEPVLTKLKLLGAAALNEVTPAIKGLSNVFVQMLNGGMDFSQIITLLFNSLMTAMPQLSTVGAQMITTLGDGIKSNLPSLTSKALDMILSFVDTIAANLPQLIQAGAGFIQNIVQGLMNALPVLIEKTPLIVSKIANLINDNAPTILKAGFNIIVTIAKGIMQAVPVLLANIPQILKAILDAWLAFNWLNLGEQGIKLLADGIKASGTLAKNAANSVKDWIVQALQKLPSQLMTLGKNAISSMSKGITSMVGSIRSSAAKIGNTIVEQFRNLPSEMVSIGTNIIKGIGRGLENAKDWLYDKITGIMGSVVDWAQDALDINSPSKVFRDEVGVYIAEGIGEGITRKLSTVKDAVHSTIGGALNTAKQSIKSVVTPTGSYTPAMAGVPQAGTVTNFYQYNNSPKSLSRYDIYRQTKNLLNQRRG